MRRSQINAREHRPKLMTVPALCLGLTGLFPSVALACPICFQVDDTNTVAGVRAGVVVLMSVTLIVLGAVAAFSIRLWRNERSGGRDA